MSRTLMPALTQLASDVPDDPTSLDEPKKAILREGVCTLLADAKYCCSGSHLASQSVRSIVTSRGRALAVARGSDTAMAELAVQHNLDPTLAPALLAAQMPSVDVQSLIQYVDAITTQEIVGELVTDAELATIQDEEIAKNGKRIKDPAWTSDIKQLVDRIVPHTITSTTTTPEGLTVVQTEETSVKLTTLQPEVDDYGEICAWTYEES